MGSWKALATIYVPLDWSVLKSTSSSPFESLVTLSFYNDGVRTDFSSEEHAIFCWVTFSKLPSFMHDITRLFFYFLSRCRRRIMNFLRIQVARFGCFLALFIFTWFLVSRPTPHRLPRLAGDMEQITSLWRTLYQLGLQRKMKVAKEKLSCVGGAMQSDH